ncbi:MULTISPECIES: porin [Pandoraea]|uniref:Porin n=1 Tax=Pandoraea communis TaxID=2508297 RepID=A0A5E4XUY4_9BURK|nr:MULTISPECIES: porin [Pandoraea]ALS66627.1 porin [Pandoraea apista]CFB61391.1 Outer membrane porin protein precursor [Pandoraea apista]VVE40136.1 porin [Pandoraea communis]
MRFKYGFVALLMGVSFSALAQSSVTIYGVISDGIGYFNNEGGHSNVRLVSGANQNNRLGFRVNEDLGGGISTIATLENGFDINQGSLGQGGRMFGRQAFVGLSSREYGTITIGRQYDVLWDYLDRIEPHAMGPGLATSIGSNDNIEGNFRYSNSVKYKSPEWKGLEFEALYAFSNKAGDFTQNRAYSAGINYAWGSQRYALTYLNIDQPGTTNSSGAVSNDYSGGAFQLFHTSPLSPNVGVQRQRVFAGGAENAFGRVRLGGIISDVRYSYLDGTSLHLDNFDLTAVYNISPALDISAAYVYSMGHYGGIDASSHWNQVQLGADYYLSKRTDVYAYVNYVRASGSRATAVLFLAAAASSTNTQTALLAGIRHKF